MNDDVKLLGPCIGHTTTTSAKIWIYAEEYKDKKLFIKIYQDGNEINSQVFHFDNEVPAACIEFQALIPNTKYTYKIFIDETGTQALDLDSLNDEDLFFWTMPEEGMEEKYRYDFLILSCNNPVEAENKGYKNKGWQVWKTLPQIIHKTTQHHDKASSHRVLFAIFSGDQVYADSIEKEILLETNEVERLKKYLNIYKAYWGNKNYRKVLCSLPAYLMWDDHDITDGWGSREDSFKDSSNQFIDAWQSLFNTANKASSAMQFSRNPLRLSNAGFDTAFRAGKAGFVLADLRSNRNLRDKKIWSDAQFNAVKNWIESQRETIDVLFFVSPVVFAHGAQKIESGILKYWKRLHEAIDRVWEVQHQFSKLRTRITNAITGFLYLFYFLFLPPLVSIPCFLIFLVLFYFFQIPLLTYLFANLMPPMLIDSYYNSIGDLRDDVNDAWSAEINNETTEKILHYFFDLQNDKNIKKQVYVTILTGDIHSAGYSNIYSNLAQHKACPVIHHIVASPVAYPPFPWWGEALFRYLTRDAVKIGNSGSFTAQIAHHFTDRNAVVCSLRNYGDENLQLKAKFYVEGFPEPQTSVFNLERSSHKEDIKWNASE